MTSHKCCPPVACGHGHITHKYIRFPFPLSTPLPTTGMFIPPGIVEFATNTTSSSASSSICDDVHHCRTVSVIIFSCTSTMFLCTWVAYHPDVPKNNPHQAWWTKLFRRIRYMLVALLAPEYVFFNAFMQWVDACGNCRDLIG